MSIMWKYLDKRSATIAAIKDYEAMQFIIDNTDAEIKRAHEKMTSLGSPKWDGMPRTHNPQAGEERIGCDNRHPLQPQSPEGEERQARSAEVPCFSGD